MGWSMDTYRWASQQGKESSEKCQRHGQHPTYGRHLCKAGDKKGQNRKGKIMLWEKEIKIILILLNHRNILHTISDCIEGHRLGDHVSLEESYFHFSYEAELGRNKWYLQSCWRLDTRSAFLLQQNHTSHQNYICLRSVHRKQFLKNLLISPLCWRVIVGKENPLLAVVSLVPSWLLLLLVIDLHCFTEAGSVQWGKTKIEHLDWDSCG